MTNMTKETKHFIKQTKKAYSKGIHKSILNKRLIKFRKKLKDNNYTLKYSNEFGIILFEGNNSEFIGFK